jgi:hypothetical protein
MGIQDEALFDKAYEEINPSPRIVEGRGEFLLTLSTELRKDKRFIEIVGREPGFRNNFYFWFATEAQRHTYRRELEEVIRTQFSTGKFKFTEESGPYFMTRPKVFATLRYRDKDYEVTDEFGYGYNVDAAIYYWAEGNFSCDCNRRDRINRQHPGVVPPEEIGDGLGGECGDTIECVAFRIELID